MKFNCSKMEVGIRQDAEKEKGEEQKHERPEPPSISINETMIKLSVVHSRTYIGRKI